MNKRNSVIAIIVVTIMLFIGILINLIVITRAIQQAEEQTVVQEKDTQEGGALDDVVARDGECVYAVDSTVTKIVDSLVELTDCTGNVWLVDNNAQARAHSQRHRRCTQCSVTEEHTTTDKMMRCCAY